MNPYGRTPALTMDFVRGALAYKDQMDEIRVHWPTRQSLSTEMPPERENKILTSYADFISEFVRNRKPLPPYLQIIGIVLHKPGIVLVAEPNANRASRAYGRACICAEFHLNDLELLAPDDPTF